MKPNRLILCLVFLISIPLSADGIDASINAVIQPITNILSSFIFYEYMIFNINTEIMTYLLVLNSQKT